MTVDYVVAESHTAGMTGAEPVEFWRQHVRLNHGRLDFEFGDADHFDGSTIVQRFCDHQVIEFWSDAVAYVRRPEHARADDDRSLRVIVPRAGSVTVESADGVHVVEPGAAAIVCMASAFTVRHDAAARAWILNVPEHQWMHPLPIDAVWSVDLTSGAGVVTRGLVQALSEQRDALSGAEFASISSRFSELLDLCAGRRPGGRLELVEGAARDLVRRRSDDPGLTPARLADQIGWSLRQVQVALAAAGTTPAALIRSTRLARARERLLTPSNEARTISEIALASGFGSLSGFNAAFRDAFGASPRALRAAARSGRQRS